MAVAQIHHTRKENTDLIQKNLRSKKLPKCSCSGGCTIQWCLKSVICTSTGNGELRREPSSWGYLAATEALGDRRLEQTQSQYPGRQQPRGLWCTWQNMNETGAEKTVPKGIWVGRVKGSPTCFTFESGCSSDQLKTARESEQAGWIHSRAKPRKSFLANNEWVEDQIPAPLLEFLGGSRETDWHLGSATVKPSGQVNLPTPKHTLLNEGPEAWLDLSPTC